MGSEDGSAAQYKEKDGKRYKYKLAWWENDNEGRCSIAYGDEYWTDTASSLLHFMGSHGEVVIPTKTMKFVIK